MDNIDVELNALLNEDNSQVSTTSGASAQYSGSDNISPDIAETSQRAQERIRQLVAENNRLKEEKTQDKPQVNWLDTIEDEGTRNLLQKTIDEAVTKATRSTQPMMNEFQTRQFEDTFKQYEGIDSNLGKFKEELKKEFIRNPSMNVKSRIGEIVLDLQTNKLRPLENRQSQSPRGEEPVNLDNASKEDLYAMLKAKKNY